MDVKDDKGCTPCHLAALNGHVKAVELLLDRFKAKVMFVFQLVLYVPYIYTRFIT